MITILLTYLNVNKSFHLGSYWFNEIVNRMQIWWKFLPQDYCKRAKVLLITEGRMSKFFLNIGSLLSCSLIYCPCCPWAAFQQQVLQAFPMRLVLVYGHHQSPGQRYREWGWQESTGCVELSLLVLDGCQVGTAELVIPGCLYTPWKNSNHFLKEFST